MGFLNLKPPEKHSLEPATRGHFYFQGQRLLGLGSTLHIGLEIMLQDGMTCNTQFQLCWTLDFLGCQWLEQIYVVLLRVQQKSFVADGYRYFSNTLNLEPCHCKTSFVLPTRVRNSDTWHSKRIWNPYVTLLFSSSQLKSFEPHTCRKKKSKKQRGRGENHKSCVICSHCYTWLADHSSQVTNKSTR